MNFKMMSFAVLATLSILFVVQNIAVVEIRFLFWSLKISQALFVFLLLVIGNVMGWVLHGYYTHRKG